MCNLVPKLTDSLRVALLFTLLGFAFWQTNELATAGTAPLMPNSGLSCAAPIRIMPLGDSITHGVSSGVEDPTLQVGYRLDLWRSLVAAGYNVDFVGSLQNGEYYQTAEGFDPDHQGRRRYPAERIADNIYGWLTNNPADVILLHIGTNQLSVDPAQVERILNEIDRFDPNIIVVLAKITNWTPYNPTVTEFNTNVETMALARIANGDQIVMVDMENGAGFHYEIQPTGDMWDQVHPYATGYTKMAAVWLNALDDLLPICTAGVNILSQPPTTATVGQGYTYDVQASGFPLPTYTLLASPDGMTIDSATGIITWLPTAPGSFSVTVEAANNIGADSQSFTITTVEESNAPVLTSTPVTQGAVNQPYHYDVEATGAPAPTYALTAAPPGMTIDAATGLIAWTPTMIGNFAVTVEATNSNGSDSQSFTLTIVEVAACTTNQIAYWPLNEPSGSTLFTDLIGNHQGSCTGASCPTATGGQVAGAFAFDGGDGIAVPTAPALTWGSNDSFSLELLVNTTQSCVGNKVFLGKYKSSGNKASWWLGCEASGKALFSLRDSGGAGVELTSLAPINDGQWHHLVAVRDGNAGQNLLYLDGVLQNATNTSYTGNFVSTSDLNIGYYTNNYHFAGVLDEIAIYGLALPSAAVQQQYQNSLAGTPYCTSGSSTAPTITSSPVTVATVGQSYSYAATADGTPAPSYSLSSAPSGMSIDSGSGLISWLPDSAGSFAVTVVATNSAGSDSQSFIIEVTAVTSAPTITSSPVTVATVGQSYSYAATADGTPAPSYSLSSAPSGMSIDSGSGLISWLPESAGSFAVTVVATNSAGSDSQSFIIEVTAVTSAPTITSSPVTVATVGQSYSYAATADGTPAPSYSLSSAPNGMSIDSGSGLISWLPESAGSFAVTVVATNSAGSDSQSFTVVVGEVNACSVGRLAHWPFNEPSGSTLFTDAVGNHHGQCVGSNCPTSTAGQVNGALAFDGNDAINVTEVADFNWTNDASFSFELWVNTTQSCVGNKVFLGKYKSSGNKASWWIGCEASGKALFSLRDSGGRGGEVTSLAPINDGQWHHLVAVRDGSVGQNLLYLDGVLQNTANTSYTGNFVSTNDLNIGYYTNGYHMSGLLDEIAIYGTVLSAATVQEHYQQSLSGLPYCSVASAAVRNDEAAIHKVFLPITMTDNNGTGSTAMNDVTQLNAGDQSENEQLHQQFLPLITR